jgi:hypothetical protein
VLQFVITVANTKSKKQCSVLYVANSRLLKEKVSFVRLLLQS